jgi:hypothetical protein
MKLTMEEQRHEQAECFIEEFRDLVRKYAKTSRFSEADLELLYMLQDRTSVFNPYIWE